MIRNLPGTKEGLSISDLQHSYGKEAVLRNLSWTLEGGKIHGLVGWNGAGKTTLFRLLAGSQTVQSGQISWTSEALSPNQTALLETHPFFYPKISGAEYLGLFQSQNPGFDVEGWNDIFGLPLREVVDGYSTGMKKKLAFIAALATGRPLLLLDEPFSGVDLTSNEVLKQVIRKLSERGTTLVVSSHLLEGLEGLCDSISFLYEGRIRMQVEKEDYHLLRKELESCADKTSDGQLDRLIDRLDGLDGFGKGA